MNIKKNMWGDWQLVLLLICVLSCGALQAQSGNDSNKSATDSQAVPAAPSAAPASGVATDDATYVIWHLKKALKQK